MIVFDLQCPAHHVFEGWFGSEDDFQAQCKKALLACPMCGATNILKKLSAPRLSLGNSDQDAAQNISAEVSDTTPQATAQQNWLELSRRILANTEDVGKDFPDEARRIHDGESPDRGIRGFASPAQTKALLDEGIAVLPFVIPESLKNRLH
jgi:hypothetical protein